MDINEIPVVNDPSYNTNSNGHGSDSNGRISHDEYEVGGEEQEMVTYDESDDDEEDEEYFTPGSEKLLEARMDILKFALKRASKRIQQSKEAFNNQNFIKALKHRRAIAQSLQKAELMGTQLIVDNTRAISAVRFNGDSSLIACGSWDGNVYFLRREDLELQYKLDHTYHQEKASAIDWDKNSSNLFISGGNEGDINLWRVQGDSIKLKPEKTINNGHDNRITKALFHPSSRYFATTSFDQTWKLWDTERCEESLVQQEGHSKELFSGAFHPDGSLFASGGLDAILRIWDLRSGRSISTLTDHIKGIYAMDFSNNGYHLASASGDSSIKIWDLRMLGRRSDSPLFSIPAHSSLVSDVRFFNQTLDQKLSEIVTDENDNSPEILNADATFLVSSSYDGTTKIWSADNWALTKILNYNDKAMSCDVSGDGTSIVSCGWDKTVKLWEISF